MTQCPAQSIKWCGNERGTYCLAGTGISGGEGGRDAGLAGMSAAELSTAPVMVVPGDPVRRSLSGVGGGEPSPGLAPMGYFIGREVGPDMLRRNAMAVTRPTVEIRAKSEGRDGRV